MRSSFVVLGAAYALAGLVLLVYLGLAVALFLGIEDAFQWTKLAGPALVPVWVGFAIAVWPDRPVAHGSWRWSWRHCAVAGAIAGGLVLAVHMGVWPAFMDPFPMLGRVHVYGPLTVVVGVALGAASGACLLPRFRPDGARSARTGWKLCPKCTHPEYAGRANCSECGAVMAGPVQPPKELAGAGADAREAAEV